MSQLVWTHVVFIWILSYASFSGIASRIARKTVDSGLMYLRDLSAQKVRLNRVLFIYVHNYVEGLPERFVYLSFTTPYECVYRMSGVQQKYLLTGLIEQII